MNIKFIQKLTAILLVLSIFLTSCSSSTLIMSEPSGAKLYLNGEYVGQTPYQHKDRKVVGTTTNVRLEKQGYEVLHTSFSKDEDVDVGAIIGGIFFLFPFIWTMKYNPTRTFELTPAYGAENFHEVLSGSKTTITSEKAEKLRELKKLLDEKIITQEEFEREKKKILEAY